MKICGLSQNKTIINPIGKLMVSGMSHNIIIKSHINEIIILGMNSNITIQAHVDKIIISGALNKIDGLDMNCIIGEITINGVENDVNLNLHCLNIKRNIRGEGNKFRINGYQININPNSNANTNSNVNANTNTLNA